MTSRENSPPQGGRHRGRTVLSEEGLRDITARNRDDEDRVPHVDRRQSTPGPAPACRGPNLSLLLENRAGPQTAPLLRRPTVGAGECPSMPLRTKYLDCVHQL